MSLDAMKIGRHPQLDAETPEVLVGFGELSMVGELAGQLDDFLRQIALSEAFQLPVNVSDMTAVANYLCGYITNDDISFEVECVRENSVFRTEVAIAVYAEDRDSYVPHFELRSVESTPTAALERCLSIVEPLAEWIVEAGAKSVNDLVEAARRLADDLAG